jgi:probable F420-dependent oxidoreductase
VRFGVQHPSADPAWTAATVSGEAVRRFAVGAERAGFSAVGFTDHPAPSARWVDSGGEGSIDPFAALGFCAAVTADIRLLTFVLALPYRNPFLLAHQVASLDALSAGRLVLGVGTGYLRGEFRPLGADFDGRRERFDEAVEVLRASFSGGDVNRSDAGYEARDTRIQPQPVRPGGPPLWIHGNSRWGRERAARWAQGWLAVLTSGAQARTMRTAPLPDLRALAGAIADLRERTQASGRDGTAVEVVVAGRWPLLDVRTGWNADQLREQAEELADLGVDHAVLVVAGDDPGASEQTVLQLGEQLVRPSCGTGPAGVR